MILALVSAQTGWHLYIAWMVTMIFFAVLLKR